MSTSVVSSHQLSTFTTPVNGTTPIDANQVKGNDNTIKTSYNAHDSDSTIHVQDSTLASRPAAGTLGRKWLSNDGYRLYFDDGAAWHEAAYLPTAAGGTVTGNIIASRLIANADLTGAIAYGVFTDGTVPANNSYAPANVLTHLISKASALSSGAAVTAQCYHKQTAANAAGSIISHFAYIDSAHTSGTSNIHVASVASVEATGNGGTTTTLSCYRTQSVIGTGHTVTTLRMLDVRSPSNSGTITTVVGADIQSLSGGSTHYALRTSATASGAINDVVFNASGVALATNATEGFVFIPSCAGTPTGVPTHAATGVVPIVYDSTNNKLCVYNGAWKQTAALT